MNIITKYNVNDIVQYAYNGHIHSGTIQTINVVVSSNDENKTITKILYNILSDGVHLCYEHEILST